MEDQERQAVREKRAKEAAASTTITKRPRLDEITQGPALDADEPYDEVCDVLEAKVFVFTARVGL